MGILGAAAAFVDPGGLGQVGLPQSALICSLTAASAWSLTRTASVLI